MDGSSIIVTRKDFYWLLHLTCTLRLILERSPGLERAYFSWEGVFFWRLWSFSFAYGKNSDSGRTAWVGIGIYGFSTFSTVQYHGTTLPWVPVVLFFAQSAIPGLFCFLLTKVPNWHPQQSAHKIDSAKVASSNTNWTYPRLKQQQQQQQQEER